MDAARLSVVRRGRKGKARWVIGRGATYLVPRSLPRFDRLVMLLAGSWQRKEPMRVTVEGTDILAVDPTLSPKADE